MALEPPDPLDRAIEAVRGEPTPDTWEEISTSVMGRVRTLVRPSQPLLVHTGDGSTVQDADGSETVLQSRVVVSALRRLFGTSPTVDLADVRLRVEDRHLEEIEVDLVCAYGTPLHPLAEEVRRQVLDVLRELVGPDPALGPASVSVQVVDVVADPSELH